MKNRPTTSRIFGAITALLGLFGWHGNKPISLPPELLKKSDRVYEGGPGRFRPHGGAFGNHRRHNGRRGQAQPYLGVGWLGKLRGVPASEMLVQGGHLRRARA